MVRPERIELPTSWFVAKHSIQLSYGRIVRNSVATSNVEEVRLYRKRFISPNRRTNLVTESAHLDYRPWPSFSGLFFR